MQKQGTHKDLCCVQLGSKSIHKPSAKAKTSTNGARTLVISVKYRESRQKQCIRTSAAPLCRTGYTQKPSAKDKPLTQVLLTIVFLCLFIMWPLVLEII